MTGGAREVLARRRASGPVRLNTRVLDAAALVMDLFAARQK
jgi:hypothetical protein